MTALSSLTFEPLGDGRYDACSAEENFFHDVADAGGMRDSLPECVQICTQQKYTWNAEARDCWYSMKATKAPALISPMSTRDPPYSSTIAFTTLGRKVFVVMYRAYARASLSCTKPLMSELPLSRFAYQHLGKTCGYTCTLNLSAITG